MSLRFTVGTILTFFALVLLPARAEECKPLKGLWLDLTPTPQGYLVPMSVNGSPHLFLLNLQDPYAILESKVVDALDLPTKPPNLLIKDGDKKITKVATAETIQLGVLPRHGAEFLVRDHDPSWGPKADGKIGVNVFSGLDLELDLAHNKLALFLPDHCPFRPYWPFTVVGNAPFVVTGTGSFLMPMTLDGKKIIVDFGTAKPTTEMSGTAASMIFGVDEKSDGAVPDGKDEDGKSMFRYPFQALVADDITIKNPQIFVRHDDHKPCGGVAGDWYNLAHSGTFCLGGGDVTLGIPILKRLRLFFDFKAMKVYFTPVDAGAK